MARLKVSTVLDASPKEVWADIEDVSSHVEWMEDAVAIEFVTPTTAGVGTAFDCDTKVGPIRLTDRMEITKWEPGKAMGVTHSGIVTGTGEFRLTAKRKGRTRFVWDERLTFPWWLGGPIGSLAAVPVMKLVWRRNLRNLEQRFER